MADKRSLYEENFIMHSENARLCRKIEAFERDMEYRTHVSELVSSYEARNRKLERALEKERKERARYHDLWQEQVKRNRLNRFTDEDIAIDNLKAELEELKKVNEQLTVQLQKAEEQIKKLRAQMNRDHENSSIPSSQKPFHKKIPNSRIRTDRKPGGQPGHPGHRRPSPEPTEPAIILPPPEEISGNDDFYPTGQFIIKRVADLHIGFNVKEYRAEVWRSRSTGKRVHASFPEGVTNEFNYGSNAKALAFLLTDYCNVSIDKTSEIIAGISGGGILLSKGMINRLPSRFSSATESDRQHIYSMLLLSPAMHTDFTPVRVNGTVSQTLVCASDQEILYLSVDHKGHKGIRGTPVEEYRQTLVHDHDRTFYHYGGNHQECLAHVLRYLQDSIDNEPELTWNREMKSFLQGIIHEAKENREFSTERISEIRSTYDRILDTAASEYRQKSPSGYYRNGKNLSKRLAEYKDAHLYFLEHPEVAYTNNLAERSLRKIKRKMKQAVTFRSKDTAVHLCNCMSVIETGKLQGADIFSTSVKAFS